MNVGEWFKRLVGHDEESKEIRRHFQVAVSATPVAQAADEVLAATELACRAARRELRRTPPPPQRIPSLPNIPKDLFND